MLFVKVFFSVLILLIVQVSFLLQLRKEERLTEEQHERLKWLTNRLETAHAERMRYVVALAEKRGSTLEQTMDDLGLQKFASYWFNPNWSSYSRQTAIKQKRFGKPSRGIDRSRSPPSTAYFIRHLII